MKKTNKLTLNRETLRTLAGAKLEAVAGGIDIISINRPTCIGWACTSRAEASCQVNAC